MFPLGGGEIEIMRERQDDVRETTVSVVEAWTTTAEETLDQPLWSALGT